ncbi:MAG: hypothetical protein GY854_05285 [Deltaproteobacteria bacterium]|nr:hypothetical protein [Deltaproteobacteria bacterium]
MSNPEQRESQRDTNLSTFGVIMETLCRDFEQIETAVFYDKLGETIDYFTLKDPYIIRLVAAHHGLVFESANVRTKWLNMGVVEMIEITMAGLDTVTVRVGEDIYLSVITQTGTIDDEIRGAIENTVKLLREEAGY